jgi:hypothetical protein
MRSDAQLRTRVAVGFVVWLAVCAVAWFFGLQPHPLLVALVIAAVGGALLLLVDGTSQSSAPSWVQGAPGRMRRFGDDPRLAFFTRVVNGHLVAHEPGDQLHRQLTTLADQRLMARHGLSRLADPDRAHAVLGPELTALVTTTAPYPRLSARHIDVLLSRIEEL